MLSRTMRDVTIPDEGDLIPAEVTLPVEAIRAYSMGRIPLADGFRDLGVRIEEDARVDDGTRIRVAQVKIDGVWQPL
jgi:hypothetical protein